MKTSQDEFVRGGGGTPPCAGVTPNVLSEVQTPIEEKNSQTGVSTRSALHEINAPPKLQPLICSTMHLWQGKEGIRVFSKSGYKSILPDHYHQENHKRQEYVS